MGLSLHEGATGLQKVDDFPVAITRPLLFSHFFLDQVFSRSYLSLGRQRTSR